MASYSKARKLFRILGDSAWRNALLTSRVAAGVEHEQILRQLGEVSTVIDVGANTGQFALVARSVFPDAEILCIEPLPDAIRTLSKVFRSDSRVAIEEYALGDNAGAVKMHMSAAMDSSSVLPITALQSKIFPGTHEVGLADVEMVTLGDIVNRRTVSRPTLLKIDVQGYEDKIIRGGRQCMENIDYIYVEASFVELYEGQGLASELIRLCHDSGFELSGIYNCKYGPGERMVQCDFLFSSACP